MTDDQPPRSALQPAGQGLRRRRAPQPPKLTDDPWTEFTKGLRDLGWTPAEVAVIALGDDHAEFVAYLQATRTEITTMRRLTTAMHRFTLSRATAAALARLDAEITEPKPGADLHQVSHAESHPPTTTGQPHDHR